MPTTVQSPASTSTTADREIVLTRVFNAPAGVVFDVWTNPVHQPHWLGGDGFTTTLHELDPRPGGVWRFTMHGPDGRDYAMDAVFTEVDSPRRLAYKHTSEPVGADVSVTFEDQGDKTRVTLHIIFPTAAERDLMIRTRGAETVTKQSLDRVAARLDFLAESNKTLRFERILDAPRDLVFKAWTDPRHLGQWWGPGGFTNPVCEADARPGGKINIHMQAPNGVVYPMHGHFVELVEPERIVFMSGVNEAYGSSRFEVRNTVTLADHGSGKTRLTVDVSVVSATDAACANLTGAEMGWTQSLDRLAEHLERQPVTRNRLVIRRVFNAPRDLVFKAWTDPHQASQWWGPQGFSNPVCEMDVRPGGRILIHMRDPGGNTHFMNGEFIEIAEPERLVFDSTLTHSTGTVSFEGRHTVTFSELIAGQTVLTLTAQVAVLAASARGSLAGMESGWNQSLDRLESNLQR